MSILVVLENHHNALADNCYPLVTAASQISTEIVALVAGWNCQSAALQAAKISGVNKVLIADHECYQHHLADTMAALITHLSDSFSHILMPASSFGKDILARASGRLKLNMISDVQSILNVTTFKRPIYAGNAIETVKSCEKKQLLTIRVTAFERADKQDKSAPIESIAFKSESQVTWESVELTHANRPDLTSAKVVVSGGRGLQSEAGFIRLSHFADQIGAAIGASRAAVDAGYAANDLQVGQTGKIVAPNVYIAFGISGAIQHLAGIKDSKVIIAIDKDPDAPIFQIADYGLVADLFQVLDEIEQQKVEKT